MFLEQVEHALDIGQCLPDFPIDDAEEIEGDVELDQEGIDQNQVADRHLAGHHATGSAPHHGGDTEGDDRGLAEVEVSQRGLGLRVAAASHLASCSS